MDQPSSPFDNPSPQNQIPAEAGQIKTIGILHIIFGSLLTLVGVIYMFLFLMLMITLVDRGHLRHRDEELFLLSIIITFIFLPMGILTLIGGIKLQKFAGNKLAMVMGCIMMISIPLGTILGIFTVIVLSKPVSKQIFEHFERKRSGLQR